MSVQIMIGDCRDILDTLPDASVQTVVTSPPYYGLRDYGKADQIGLEETPEEYIAEMVDVFRKVRRVLRDDGTVWLNLGDSYAGAYSGNNGYNDGRTNRDKRRGPGIPVTCKPKDLIGIPWRVALALQADGWYLRSDIIWHKPNPMPESVTDRPTKAHEYVFLLTKSARYFYDADAVREDNTEDMQRRARSGHTRGANGKLDKSRNDFDTLRGRDSMIINANGRNRRSVWSIATKPYSGAHFAVMPPDLVEPCIKAGSAAGDTVLDPFAGAGTVGLVADRLGRDAILIELNADYAEMAQRRIVNDAPMFARVEVK